MAGIRQCWPGRDVDISTWIGLFLLLAFACAAPHLTTLSHSSSGPAVLPGAPTALIGRGDRTAPATEAHAAASTVGLEKRTSSGRSLPSDTDDAGGLSQTATATTDNANRIAAATVDIPQAIDERAGGSARSPPAA